MTMSKKVYYGHIDDVNCWRFVAEDEDILEAAMATKARQIMEEENTWAEEYDGLSPTEVLEKYDNYSECGEFVIEELYLLETPEGTVCCKDVPEEDARVAAASARLILMGLAKLRAKE
jgi:hypothetical protein